MEKKTSHVTFNEQTHKYTIPAEMAAFARELAWKLKAESKEKHNKGDLKVSKALSMITGNINTQGQLMTVLGESAKKPGTGENPEISEEQLTLLTSEEVITGLEKYYHQATEKQWGTAAYIAEQLLDCIYESKAKVVDPLIIKKEKQENISEKEFTKKASKVLKELASLGAIKLDFEGLHFLGNQEEQQTQIEKLIKETFDVYYIKKFLEKELGMTFSTGQTVIPWGSVMKILYNRVIKQKEKEEAWEQSPQASTLEREKNEYVHGKYDREEGKYYPNKEMMGYFNELHKISNLSEHNSNTILQKVFQKTEVRSKFGVVIGKLSDNKRSNYLETNEIRILQDDDILKDLKSYHKKALKNPWGTSGHVIGKIIEMIEKDMSHIHLPLQVIETKENIVYAGKAAQICTYLIDYGFIERNGNVKHLPDENFQGPLLKLTCAAAFNADNMEKFGEKIQISIPKKGTIPREDIFKKLYQLARDDSGFSRLYNGRSQKK